MAFFVVKQLPVLVPNSFSKAEKDELIRIGAELSFTSAEMRDAALAVGCDAAPFVWNDNRRQMLRAKADALLAQLYGLNRKQLRYILDPHGLSDKELEDITSDWEDPTCSGPHLLPANPTKTFPGETFRVLKEKETKQYGEYRTRRLVLEAWEKLQQGTLHQ
jgi:hypothetical protein